MDGITPSSPLRLERGRRRGGQEAGTEVVGSKHPCEALSVIFFFLDFFLSPSGFQVAQGSYCLPRLWYFLLFALSLIRTRCFSWFLKLPPVEVKSFGS